MGEIQGPVCLSFPLPFRELLARQLQRPCYTKSMSYMDRITFNPKQCGGRPCIRGMRIRVVDVLDLLAAGVPEKEILEDYPDLEAEDIRACLQYASAQANHAILQPA